MVLLINDVEGDVEGETVSTRLVVTRIDATGKSVFDVCSVAPVIQKVNPAKPLMQAGKSYTTLWGTPSGVPSVGAGIDEPSLVNPFFAGPGETRFVLFALPPAGAAPEMFEGDEDDVDGLVGVFDDDSSGMHATDTVDYVFVVSGEIVLELDDGAQVTLTEGDCVVQRGTRHAWRNYSSEPARVAAFMVGAERAAE